MGDARLAFAEIQRVFRYFGNPQNRMPPVIHITGTNGKGSVAAFLLAMLMAGGYRVHRLTSPHLCQENERIMVANTPMEKAWLEAWKQDIGRISPALTFPQVMTVAAFCAFAEVSADVALVEVGIGGRLDSTNVVTTTCVSVVTPISLDHQAMLGPLLADIAREKSGILRSGVPCVSAQQPEEARQEIEQHASHQKCPLWMQGHDWHMNHEGHGLRIWDKEGWEWHAPQVSLCGRHQRLNGATAVMAARAQRALVVSEQNMQDGLALATWPGRLQRLSEGEKKALNLATRHDHDIWIDGAHNEGGFVALAQWIKDQSWDQERDHLPLHVILGMLPHKDSSGFWNHVAPLARNIWVLESWGGVQGQSLSWMQASRDVSFLRLSSSSHSLHPTKELSWDCDHVRVCPDWSHMHHAIENSAHARWILCGSLYFMGFILGHGAQEA